MDKVTDIKNMSDTWTNRARVCFENGYEISIISGAFVYSSAECPYEIAVFNPSGNMIEFDGDTVIGYQTKEEVIHWVNMVANLEQEK
jgi:hypothetical protein